MISISRLHQGQATAEFLVALIFFLVPAILGINYLARLGDAKHKSYEAARYGVWERTVWHQSNTDYNVKNDLAISREINQRIFGDQSAAIDSVNDQRSVAASSIVYDANLYGWSTVSGSRPTIIETPSRSGAEPNQLTISDSSAPGSVSGRITRIQTAALGLSRNGFYNSNITLQLHKDPKLVNELNNALGSGVDFTTQSNNAMLVGAWNGSGPDGVRRTVQRTVPASFLTSGMAGTAFTALQTAARIAGFQEFDRLVPGYVDPERVPCQRIRNLRGRGLGC